jgi:hypothetical protein
MGFEMASSVPEIECTWIENLPCPSFSKRGNVPPFMKGRAGGISRKMSSLL